MMHFFDDDANLRSTCQMCLISPIDLIPSLASKLYYKFIPVIQFYDGQSCHSDDMSTELTSNDSQKVNTNIWKSSLTYV